MASEIAKMKEEIENLKSTIRKTKQQLSDVSLSEVAKDVPPLPATTKLSVRRILKGHLAKIYAMDWAPQKYNVLSASQDGKLMVWDAISTNPVHCVPLQSSWVMCCAYGRTGNLVAAGGLDNTCTIYNLDSKELPIPAMRSLMGHNGYVSSCKFVGANNVITASGDGSCKYWDSESGACITSFDQSADQLCLTASPDSEHLFISGSTSSMCYLFDVREKKCVKSWEGHESDVNGVRYFPSRQAFGSSSDDATCRLWDIRADRCLMTYANDRILSSMSSVDFSKSGRLLFAGSDDFNCYAYDVLNGKIHATLSVHENRVSCLGVAPDGMGLCTGSWDGLLAIWA